MTRIAYWTDPGSTGILACAIFAGVTRQTKPPRARRLDVTRVSANVVEGQSRRQPPATAAAPYDASRFAAAGVGCASLLSAVSKALACSLTADVAAIIEEFRIACSRRRNSSTSFALVLESSSWHARRRASQAA